MKYGIGILLILVTIVMSCNDDTENNNNLTTLTLNFKGVFDNTTLVVSDTYTYTDELDITINEARFFISEINLVKSDGNKIMIKDIGVVNFAQNHTSVSDKNEPLIIENVPIGDYVGIEFGIGVDSVLNSAIPPDFDNDHPLSAASEYWDWRETYIFSKLEGRVKRVTGEQTFFVYHAGTNTLYKKVNFQKSITLQKDQAADLEFNLDVKKWFEQTTSLIDIENNNSSHSGPDDIWLADLIITNLTNSIQIGD